MEREANGVQFSEDEARHAVATITPAEGSVAQATPTSGTPCPTCAASGTPMAPSFVYAIGRIEARFPRLSVEKEFAQATGRAETAGQTDQQAFFNVLSKADNRYLAQQMCWVMTVQGLETYIVRPRDPADLDRLIQAVRPQRQQTDIDVVIGVRGPIAPPDLCNGLMVPIVLFSRDVFVRPCLANQGNPAAAEHDGQAIRGRGRRGIRQDPPIDRQCGLER